MSVTFGERRGWNEALPRLDWACVVLTAFVVADVHFVLASVAREVKRHVIFVVGLGSEWGRIGLEWVLFSLAFPMLMLKLGLRVTLKHHATSLWVRIVVGLGWIGLIFLRFSYVNADTWAARHSKTACNVTSGCG